MPKIPFISLRRGWINQPSKHQPLHALHQTPVLIYQIPDNPVDIQIFFLSGSVESMTGFRQWVSFDNRYFPN